MLLYVVNMPLGTVSHLCAQSFPTSLIAYNLILIRVAQNRTALREPELPTFISKSKIERVTPKIPQRGSEMVAS